MTHLRYAKGVNLLSANDDDIILKYEGGLHQLGNLITSIEWKIQTHKRFANIFHQPSTIDHSS